MGAVVAVLGGSLLTASPVVAESPAHAATVKAGAASAMLTDGLVSRTWAFTVGGAVTTASLRSGSRELSASSSPDFRIDVAGVPTTSTLGWSLISVSPGLASDPSRPEARPGKQLTFRYALADAHLTTGSVELVRVVALHDGSAVLETTTTLVNRGAAALRIGQYSLDELTPATPLRTANAQVLAYHGGSDWRDDYRVTKTEAGAFDDEGETARFDDGSGAGWFFVTERRGGAASRVGREAAGRTWAGVDPARDVFDFGPIPPNTDQEMQAPDYNRLENPVYPVPVRQRTLQPNATLALGRAFTGVYADGEAGAATAFVDDFTSNVAPHFPLTVGQNSFHPWGHSPDLNGNVLSEQFGRSAWLGVERYMIDDQWQGGPGGESGDWRFDPARFPDADGDGQPDFLSNLRIEGLQLGLWMSPAEFNTASTTYAAHPDWACAPTGDVTAQIPDDAGLGVWDMTNPALQDHLSGVVDRLIEAYDVREFKFDFQAWVDCGTHDYNDYEDAFVAWVHLQQAHHPTVTFELDETNDQRAWPFESAAIGPSWFDNGHLHGSGQAAKLLHDLWTAAPWLPTSGIGMGAFDGSIRTDGCAGPCSVSYLSQLMLLSHITFWTDSWKFGHTDGLEIQWWSNWYKAHRDDLGGAVYELTGTDPLAGSGSTVFQPWSNGHGELFAFRQAGGSPVAHVGLHGVDPATTYAIRDVRTGELVTTATGAQLAAGYDIALPQEWSARTLSVDPADGTPDPVVPEAPLALLLPLAALAVGVLVLRTPRRTRRTA
ncbi:MAG: alpha-galactosidase [Actinomycetota bacterium]|nr:alpha-galactosidase [Actinomycetota bacterium]